MLTNKGYVMHKILYLFIIVSLGFCHAALPPRVQDRIDRERSALNSTLKEQASIILKAEVISYQHKSTSNNQSYSHRYNEIITLTIRPIQVIRNRDNINIPDDITLSYAIFVPRGGWVGPKFFNMLTVVKEKEYKFYLDNYFSPTARDESIETLD